MPVGAAGILIGMATVRAATARFLASQKSVHTRSRYKKDIITWKKFCQESDLHALDGSFLNAQLFSEWLEERYTPSSAISRFSGTTRWFDALLHEGIVKGHGFREVTLPKRVRKLSKVSMPTEDEMAAMMKAAESKGIRWEWALGMVAYCGLDCAEVTRIRSTDVRTWEGQTLIRVRSRAGHVREVPVNGRLEVLSIGLSGVFAPTTALAPTDSSQYLTMGLGSVSLKAIGRKVTVQDLRRFAVKRQADRGVPVPVIAKWVGHTTDLWVRQTLNMLNDVSSITQQQVNEMIRVELGDEPSAVHHASDSRLDAVSQ